MLIFDNDKQFCNLMENGFEKYPNKRDLTILCEKWLADGTDFCKIMQKMTDFCKKFNSQFNYAKSENLFLRVLDDLKKKETEGAVFKFQKNIKIYRNEIEKISQLPTLKMQKVAFVMVSLAKWRNVNFLYFNSLNSLKLKDVFMLAGVKCTGKEQNLYLYELGKVGFCEMQMRPLLKCVYPCVVSEGEVVIEYAINDNLIENWENYALPHCARCGKPFERHSNSQKYCKNCAKIVKNEQNRAYLGQKGK